MTGFVDELIREQRELHWLRYLAWIQKKQDTCGVPMPVFTPYPQAPEYCRNGHRRTEGVTEYHIDADGREQRSCLVCHRISRRALRQRQREQRVAA